MALWTPYTDGLVFEHHLGTDLATSAFNHATNTTTASVLGSWTGGTGYQDISGVGPKGLDYGFDTLNATDVHFATVVDPTTTGLTILATTGTNPAIPATARLWFDSNPTNGQTISINGQAITFVTSGATGFQVNIGDNYITTAQSTATLVNANPATFAVTAYCPPLNSVIELTAITAGTSGNSIALATTTSAAGFSARNTTTRGVTLMGSGAVGQTVSCGITQLSQNFQGRNSNQGSGGLATDTTENPAGTAGYHYVSASGYLYDFPVLRRYAGGALVRRHVGNSTTLVRTAGAPRGSGNIQSGTLVANGGAGTGSAKQSYAAYWTRVLSDAEDLANYLAVQTALAGVGITVL